MDDFKLSERVYMNGNLISQVASQKKDLADVIEEAILRLEHLMQKEMYHPTEPMDIKTLQQMVAMTRMAIPAAAVAPVPQPLSMVAVAP